MKFTATQTAMPEKSRTLLTVSIPWDQIEPLRSAAVKTLGSQVSMDGFRAGHVPEAMLLQRIPAQHILTEMADSAIQNIYIDLIKQENITPIGKPVISLKKLAEGNALEFTLETDVLPVITIPADIEKTAKKFLSPEIKVEVTDQDIEDALKEIQRMRAEHEQEDLENLPPIDDAFAQSLGKFKNLDEVKAALKENIEHEKIHHEIDKRHGEFYDTLTDSITVGMPESIVNFEIEKRLSQLEHDTAMAGHTLDEYLASIEKTRDTLIAEITPASEKSAKLELLFNEIATQANLVPDQKLVDEEVQIAVNRYKDSKDFDINRARDYFYTIHKNRMVVRHLDTLGGLPHIHAEHDHHHA